MLLDLKENKVYKEILDHKESLDQKGTEDLKATKEISEKLVQKETREILELV